MEVYNKRAYETLKKYGEKPGRISEMVQEWTYTDESSYDSKNGNSCELCGHSPIHYEFTIINKLNGNKLTIGSNCITKFDVRGVNSEGQTLTSDETKKLVNSDKSRLKTEAKIIRNVRVLSNLISTDSKTNYSSILEKVKSNESLSPKQMAFLLWRLNKYSIDYIPRDFSVRIRRDKDKEQVYELKEWQKKLVKSVLTPSQLKKYESTFEDVT